MLLVIVGKGKESSEKSQKQAPVSSLEVSHVTSTQNLKTVSSYKAPFNYKEARRFNLNSVPRTEENGIFAK